MTDKELDKFCKDCWDEHWILSGCTEAFNWKARRLTSNLRTLSFVGIAGPASIGALVAFTGFIGYYAQFVTGLLAIQLVLSIAAEVGRWADHAGEAFNAGMKTSKLALDWKHLAEDAIRNHSDPDLLGRKKSLESKVRVLAAESKQIYTDREKRYANRWIHYNRQLPCPTCGVKPRSILASNCDTCGNYELAPVVLFRKAFSRKEITDDRNSKGSKELDAHNDGRPDNRGPGEPSDTTGGELA